MWNLPGPEIKLVSPALADGFLTTGPLGKSSAEVLNLNSVTQIFVCLPPPSMIPRPTVHLPCTFLSVENLREDTDQVGAPPFTDSLTYSYTSSPLHVSFALPIILASSSQLPKDHQTQNTPHLKMGMLRQLSHNQSIVEWDKVNTLSGLQQAWRSWLIK